MTVTLLANDVDTSGTSRKQWPNQFQFLCANIAFAVGLGNIWRFPYLAQSNGGGTFLIPYFISLLIIGVPMLTLELSLGQRMRQGAIRSYKLFHRGFTGIGYSMVMVSCFVCYYYNMVVGWALYYFMSSMSNPLPWASCPVVNRTLEAGELGYGTFEESIPSPVLECSNAGSAEYYWYRETLDIADNYYPIDAGINPKYADFPITTPMTMVLCLAWLIVFYLLMNGAEATGGALYFIALMPYAVLAIFLGIGLSSDGGIDGLVRLFQPDWSALSDPQLWVKAASQIFFSLSVCYGGIISFASYNPVNHNFLRDSMIVALVNSGTSLFASCVIFALLGSRAFKRTEDCIERFTDRALDLYSLPNEMYSSYDELYTSLSEQYPEDFASDEIVTQNFGSIKCDFEGILIGDSPSGTGLIFIAVAETVQDLPGSFILSVLFFFMVITLGLGSMIGSAEGVVTPVYDLLRSKGFKVKKPVVVAVFSIILFGAGVVLTTPGGSYWLDIVDNSTGGIPLLIIGLAQFIVVGWVFGVRKWMNEIKWMVGPPSNIFDSFYRKFLMVSWAVTSPLLILGILVYYIIDVSGNPPTYKRWSASLGGWLTNPLTGTDAFEYDALGTAITIVIHLAVVLPILGYMIAALYRKANGFSWTNIKDDKKAVIYRT